MVDRERSPHLHLYWVSGSLSGTVGADAHSGRALRLSTQIQRKSQKFGRWHSWIAAAGTGEGGIGDMADSVLTQNRQSGEVMATLRRERDLHIVRRAASHSSTCHRLPTQPPSRRRWNICWNAEPWLSAHVYVMQLNVRIPRPRDLVGTVGRMRCPRSSLLVWGCLA